MAMLAGSVIGIMSTVSIDGFYPTAAHPGDWHWDGSAFMDSTRGLSIGADGILSRVDRVPTNGIAPEEVAHGRLSAALETALMGTGLSLLLGRAIVTTLAECSKASAEGKESVQTIIITAIAGAATILIFQAAAAHRVSAVLGPVPAVLLTVLALARDRSPR
jgi:hypothetical protein